jgi:septal ring factor EnvC (AmiA/AmiB activator)
MAGRMQVMDVTTRLVTEECCQCGVLFALPSDLKDMLLRKKAGRMFYCPNGHPQHYTGESFDDQIARLNSTITHLRDQRDATERSLNATKGALTKARKQVQRTEHGVCPHCNRTFANVARHMTSKHPEHAA